MDIVYLHKKGPRNSIELRYSLRSLCNVPHDKVFVIGDKPSWAKNIIHIPLKDDGPKYENVKRKQRFILDYDEISDDFVYMNDDFYFLEPIEKVEYYKIGTLKAQIGYIKDRDKNTKKRGLNVPRYCKNLEHVYKIFGNVNSMETHTPIMFNKKKMKEVLRKYPDLPPTSIRTSYCAYHKIKGKFLPNTPNYKGYKRKLIDCKVYYKEEFKVLKGQPLLSTENTMIHQDILWDYMGSILGGLSKYESHGIEQTNTEKIVEAKWNARTYMNKKRVKEIRDRIRKHRNK